MEFSASKTYKNLVASYAAECSDGAKYQFIAMKAQMAKLVTLQNTFKVLAKEEMGHAKRIFDILQVLCKKNDCKLTQIDFNASYSINGDDDLAKFIEKQSENEKHQAEVTYIAFAKDATKEGFPEVANLFKFLAAVENDHFMLNSDLCKQLSSNSLFKKQNKTMWKCSTCGFEIEGKDAPKICPLCLAEQGNFLIKTDLYKYLMP